MQNRSVRLSTAPNAQQLERSWANSFPPSPRKNWERISTCHIGPDYEWGARSLAIVACKRCWALGGTKGAGKAFKPGIEGRWQVVDTRGLFIFVSRSQIVFLPSPRSLSWFPSQPFVTRGGWRPDELREYNKTKDEEDEQHFHWELQNKKNNYCLPFGHKQLWRYGRSARFLRAGGGCLRHWG